MSDVLQRVRQANPIVGVEDLGSAEYAMALAEIEDRWEFGGRQPRVTTVRPSGWLRPALVAVGTALLIALAIGGPILFMRGSDEPVTDTTVPQVTTTTPLVSTTSAVTTTAPATTTTVPTPLPSAPAMNWQRAPEDPVFDQAVIWSVTAGGPGLVATGGSHNDQGMMIDGIIWTSEDGISWQRIDDPSFATSVPEEEIRYGNFGVGIRDAAEGPNGVVAVGFDGDVAATWYSPDGLEWSPVKDAAIQRDGLVNLLAVTAGGPGWVAVGDVDMDGGIWVTEDGLDWVLIEDEDLLAGDRIDASIYDIAVWGDRLIAVGALGIEGGSDDREERGAIWVSDDGLEWTELDDDLFRENRVFEGVSVDPLTNTVFAFGSPGGIVMSTDGATWVLNAGDGPSPSSDVSWDGERAVAGGPDLWFSLWASGDRGMTWHRVDADDPTFEGPSANVVDVTRFGDRVIVVGSDIWIGTWAE